MCSCSQFSLNVYAIWRHAANFQLFLSSCLSSLTTLCVIVTLVNLVVITWYLHTYYETLNLMSQTRIAESCCYQMEPLEIKEYN